MTLELLGNSEESEESAVSGECDESEMALLDITMAQNERLRQLVATQKQAIKALNELLMTLTAQCDLLRKELQGSNPGAPERLPQVG